MDEDQLRAMRDGDGSELLALWNAFEARMTWQTVIDRGGDRQVAERARAELADVTALNALMANRFLVDMFIERRWYVIQAAREAGATWLQIGTALGMTKQGAQDWYRRKTGLPKIVGI